MTADRDRARQELADALREWSWEQGHEELPRTPGEIADALLPVLDAYARRYAADAIKSLTKTAGEMQGPFGYPVRAVPVADLLGIAAVLRQEGEQA